MTCGQLCLPQPVFDQVPLSCVPPVISHDLAGLIATLTNCSVRDSLRSMCSIRFGMRDSSRWHAITPFVTVVGTRVVVHVDEVSRKLPSVRITPPSEPSKICVGSDG